MKDAFRLCTGLQAHTMHDVTRGLCLTKNWRSTTLLPPVVELIEAEILALSNQLTPHLLKARWVLYFVNLKWINRGEKLITKILLH